jgi:type IV pilus assembly protein PilC
MGTLSDMLDRISVYMRRDIESRSRVRAAMAYPCVMLVLALGVTVFLLTFVLPNFMPLFQRKGVDLPKPTQVMMAISDTLTNYWPFILAGAIALVVGVVVGRRRPVGRMVIDYVKINMPVLGPVTRKVVISRSLRTMGAMLTGGVSTLDAIRMSAEVSGNYYYAKLWHHVEDRVVNGQRICQALHGTPLLPATLVQMIAAGEETGKLDRVMNRVSAYFDEEVDTAIKAATAVVEPVLIACMGVVVGGIVLALLLPIFTLSQTPG